ncbi:flagellar assembly factor FliW [Lachnospiraceae bacterium PF1-21]|uniref:Flagellar assembly factor FliW n=1 Tax=Ohessyouella blattaphilus TaxID=2949333 RepID=A0ABT1EIL2_9FIRM|nr:flagellar assembly protein FliW [Ohessyouella blattaphilus]MCP1109157.1 flagellar assembly protein FliW [Ohessyouella blattaphilus]MCR8562551.1 flagellar assembly protein FliW [Ohessyouella blattaphilus]MDL2250259.1 flagellar assembly protein FliW [Lachnospiraceae bacterium OttesenSCG-928-J05]
MQELKVEFPEGILGFGEYREYIPVPISEENDAIISLQCVENEELEFIAMNPFFLLEEYEPVLTQGDYEKLGTTSEEELSYYVICVVKEPFGKSTVNLKCPLVFNSKNRQGLQVILDSNDYSMRVSLEELTKKGGA